MLLQGAGKASALVLPHGNGHSTPGELRIFRKTADRMNWSLEIGQKDEVILPFCEFKLTGSRMSRR
jgi:hypothetical protein